MYKESAIFVSNERYLDKATLEGGVKFCTDQFVALLQIKYDVIFFPINFDNSLLYRLRVRLGLNAYHDYDVESLYPELESLINQKHIRYIFLNLANTITFSKHIKDRHPAIKIILCSHGNESGDYLHDLVMHSKTLSFFKKLFGDFTLGTMIRKESEYRNKFLDMVLTVSEIEENLEKWLGSPSVFLVPRTITNDILPTKYLLGRVGFIGDLSHMPNFYGIQMLCNEINKLASKITIRLVGAHEEKGNALQRLYPFVEYLGYLDENHLKEEVATWTFSLNPVFYYSKGVSTKLGKALSWGIPVISTVIGTRGYILREGEMLLCNSPWEMANLVIHHSTDKNSVVYFRDETLKIICATPTLDETIKKIYYHLQTINNA